jgi:hypothetical protein
MWVTKAAADELSPRSIRNDHTRLHSTSDESSAANFPVRMHDVRHAHASWFVAQGSDLGSVMDVWATPKYIDHPELSARPAEADRRTLAHWHEPDSDINGRPGQISASRDHCRMRRPQEMGNSSFTPAGIVSGLGLWHLQRGQVAAERIGWRPRCVTARRKDPAGNEAG